MKWKHSRIILDIQLEITPKLNLPDFRDRFAREKRNLESTVLSLQSSLELTQERMNKEEELKGTTQAVQKQLMGEKRELLAKWVNRSAFILIKQE